VAALACFEKAAKATPDDAVLQSRYARLLREKEPQDASTALKGREALTRVTAQKPDGGRAWMELAGAPARPPQIEGPELLVGRDVVRHVASQLAEELRIRAPSRSPGPGPVRKRLGALPEPRSAPGRTGGSPSC